MTRAPNFGRETGSEADMASYDSSGQLRPEQMNYPNQLYSRDAPNYPDDFDGYEETPRDRQFGSNGQLSGCNGVSGFGRRGFGLGIPINYAGRQRSARSARDRRTDAYSTRKSRWVTS